MIRQEERGRKVCPFVLNIPLFTFLTYFPIGGRDTAVQTAVGGLSKQDEGKKVRKGKKVSRRWRIADA